MTTIRVELKRTINLGDYESTTISIAYEDDVRGAENREGAFKRIYNFVESNLNTKVDEVQDQLKPKPKRQVLIKKGKLK